MEVSYVVEGKATCHVRGKAMCYPSSTLSLWRLQAQRKRALGTLDIASIYLPRYFCVLSLFTSQ